jgi:RND superfamily putative drug exporter
MRVFDRVVALVTGRRTAWAMAVLPLLLAGLFIGLVGEAENEPGVTDGLPRGAESTAAAELRDQLPEDDGSTAVVLLTRDSGEFGPQDVGGLTEAVQRAGEQAGLPPGSPAQVSEDGTAAVAVLPVPANGATEVADTVEELRAALDETVPAGVTGQVTGPAGVEADLASVFAGADVDLLLATAGVVTVLLLLTYRSPVLWIIPLTVVGVADRFAAVLATRALDVTGVAWDESTVGILSVLVFGAGTDYSLLLISRYRDELRSRENRFEAMAQAVRRTAEAVLSSSTTVVLGLLTLLLSAFPTTRGLGLACAVGVVVAALFALFVLPAALVLFGRWVFWPRVPRVGQAQLVDSRSLWSRVGSVVAARPVTLVVASGVFLGVLMTGGLGIQTGLSTSDQFLDEPEAISAAERLGESFPQGSTDPAQVLTTEDPEQVLAAVRDVGVVTSARVAQEGNGVALVEAVLDAPAGSDAAAAAVTELRAGLDDLPRTYVGGTEAELLDEGEAAAADRLLILPLITGLVLAALVLLLRSLVAPVLLVLTVLATYLAALGLSWWLFTGVFGFEAMDSTTPLLAFLFLVALGVDYNIFLVTRAREEALGHGSRRGMLRALTATGGVITSAGILLAAVFAVLGVLPLVVLAQLGVIICVGVLLDTLLVRTVVVPALAVLLGDRFWWPRRVSGDGSGDANGDAPAQTLTPAGAGGAIGR